MCILCNSSTESAEIIFHNTIIKFTNMECVLLLLCLLHLLNFFSHFFFFCVTCSNLDVVFLLCIHPGCFTLKTFLELLEFCSMLILLLTLITNSKCNLSKLQVYCITPGPSLSWEVQNRPDTCILPTNEDIAWQPMLCICFWFTMLLLADCTRNSLPVHCFGIPSESWF